MSNDLTGSEIRNGFILIKINGEIEKFVFTMEELKNGTADYRFNEICSGKIIEKM